MSDISKKYASINYTNRDFNSLRNDLVSYAKRYYPEIVKDFSQASFASLMIDTTAYVGDILSFYLDYQMNESLLVSANDYENVLRLSKQLGYKFKGSPSAHGKVALFVLVPANNSGLGPNTEYIPILKANSVLSSDSGTSFVLKQDVDFSKPDTEVAAARVDPNTGIPISYAMRAYGEVVSGKYNTVSVSIGDFQKFRRIKITDASISEIMSVFDAQGNQYFEVDYLSQDVVYKSEINKDPSTKEQTPNLLIPFAVPRRFVVEKNRDSVDLIFGQGSDSTFLTQTKADPANVALERFGRTYTTDDVFDPSNLISNEQLGISPSNTTMYITYRANGTLDINIGTGRLTRINNPVVDFKDPTLVPVAVKTAIISSMESSNEEPITSTAFYPQMDEIKRQALDIFAAQGRAVTAQDYEAIVYHMPAQYGSVARARAVKDIDSTKRNINLYVVSTNTFNQLQLSNTATKKNLKNWINNYRMLNDTIDVMDARIVNIGINFSIFVNEPYNKYAVLQNCLVALQEKYRMKMFVGEPVNIFDIYSTLNKIDGVSDVTKVEIVSKRGANYSGDTLNIKRYMTTDGRKIIPPENVVFEIKYPLNDIIGSVK